MPNRFVYLLHIFCCLLFTCCAKGQTLQMLTSGTNASIRGLSVVNDSVLWASGSNGTVVRSTNGGKTFTRVLVKNYEQRDFRDVEAFDSNTAIIMAIAEPAIILKTTDGGQTWAKVFEDSTKGMFLDAMDFVTDSFGVVVGDPINKKPFLGFTGDGGAHWKASSYTKYYNDTLLNGEAFFASSGTNVKYIAHRLRPYFLSVTGGMQSRLFRDFSFKSNIPLIKGGESTGANSIAVNTSGKRIVVVGGDFKNDKDSTNNCAISNNYGKIWQHAQTPPHGYRSCVIFINDKLLLTCGTSGVDISRDAGINWTFISPESFHVCQKAKKGNAIFFAGKDGRIAKLNF